MAQQKDSENTIVEQQGNFRDNGNKNDMNQKFLGNNDERKHRKIDIHMTY